MTRSNFAKAALTAAAAAAALTVAAIPAAAQAQGYYGDNYNYDPCRRAETNRGTTGALVGGALGAVIGSNAAARNTRTEGALLGGALGAVAGAAVGKNSAACERQYAPRSSYYDAPSSSYYERPYYNDSRYGYQDRSYYGGDYSAYRNRSAGRYIDEGYAYDRRGAAYPMAGGAVGADGCTLAESPIYLPDGRVQKRFVRVCQDGGGRYQVVD